MKNDNLDTLAAPSTYEAAEAILQKLSGSAADSLWDELFQDQAQMLLKSLAPGFKPEPIPPPRQAKPVTPDYSDPGDDPQESRDELRTLPRLSEETLLNVLETAPDAIVVIDNRGNIVRVNAQTENIFGYDRKEMVGKKVEMLVPIRNQHGHVALRRGYFKDPHVRPMGAAEMPLFGLRKDGSEFPVEISLSPLQTDEGLLVTSVIRDVTERKQREAERKQREAELAKAEARYRSLVEEIPAVTFMAALDEGINELYVSPQIVDLLGFTQEEWLNDPVLWHRQLHPQDRDRWHREFSRTCATAQPFRAVYRFLARDGRTVWVLGEAKVVRDTAGRPMFLQGVAFDITERKEAEENLKQSNRTLEDRVASRTEDLRRSNEALADYGNHMAHTMKKPIARINDILKGPLARSQPRDPPEKRLAKIEEVANDMKKLVEGLLAYALVADRANRFVSTDCADLVREVRNELHTEIEACGAKVSFKSLPTVVAHRESLKSVFRNLIDNAIKYRAQRPLRVRVTAQLEKDSWLFKVRDNGMGIKKHPAIAPDIDYHMKIFEFGRRHHDRDQQGEKIPGHGIGLSHCQKVIEHHGGNIWVESEEGKGSTFFFTLPAIGDAANLAPE